MKRLLLIAYYFPPEPAAGALRPGYLARYLPDAGWEATVLTRVAEPPPFACRTVCVGVPTAALEARVRSTFDARGSASQNALRGVLRATKNALLFPDRAAPWIPRALRAALQETRERHYDAVVSTAMPASVHVIGALVAKMRGIPWIADYRDPWSGNRYDVAGPVRRVFERSFERRLLSDADAIVTISEPIAAHLQALHGRAEVRVIPNGYDPNEWSVMANERPKRFSLCYAGTMYDGKRSPDVLFEAVARARADGEPWARNLTIDFYGHDSANVPVAARRYGISDVVRVLGRVSRAEAMEAQRSAAVLLVFLSTDPATSGELGSKYLEYAGARRPILGFGPPQSALRPILECHGLGWFAATVDETRSALRDAYARYLDGRFETTPGEAIPTAQDLARRYAQLLDNVSRTLVLAPSS